MVLSSSLGRCGALTMTLAVATVVFSRDVMDVLDERQKAIYRSLTAENQSLVQRYYNCQELGATAGGGILPFINRFGEAITLATGKALTTQAQKDAAVDYTEKCLLIAGPAPKNVLLVKWNMYGDYIYPGTQWCGAGNKSTAEKPYGEKNATDKCCEIHDNATDYMLSRSKHEKSGLTNPKYYTVTNCTDDVKLFDCLLQSNLTETLEFGQAFFDALKVPCITYTYQRDCEYWKDNAPYVPRTCATWNKNKGKHWTLIEPPSFYYAFMRKWYNETYVPAMDPYSWMKACQIDPDLNCSHYKWINETDLY